MATTATRPTANPSVAELEAMATAPDLTRSEQRELRRTLRRARQVAKWEYRLATPHPAKTHRAVITVVMMLLTLALLWMLLAGPTH